MAVVGQESAGQDDVGLHDVLDDGYAVLELDGDVQHVALADGGDVTRGIALLIVILVNDGDNLVLHEVVDVALAAHEERRRLRGRGAVYGEVLLVVRQIVIAVVGVGPNRVVISTDNRTKHYTIANCIHLGVVLDILHCMVIL